MIRYADAPQMVGSSAGPCLEDIEGATHVTGAQRDERLHPLLVKLDPGHRRAQNLDACDLSHKRSAFSRTGI
jgi:hypothetical protein